MTAVITLDEYVKQIQYIYKPEKTYASSMTQMCHNNNNKSNTLLLRIPYATNPATIIISKQELTVILKHLLRHMRAFALPISVRKETRFIPWNDRKFCIV